MKTMNPTILGTTYSDLVVDLTKTLLGATDGQVEAADIAAFAINLADQLVLQLDAREAKAKAFAESTRVYLPVDWAPSAEDDQNRSGQHWSQAETDALVAQFKNGKTGSEIAVHHRRTWTAVSAQLAKYSLIQSTGRNGFERNDGSPWEL